MARQVKRSGSSVIVYDDRLVSQISPEMFKPDYWPDAAVVPGYSGGRGATLFINNAGSDWVLKHYHRGGMIGRWLSDGFAWSGQTRARSVIELDLLLEIVAVGLPAPVPVAAHILRKGLFYTADLITVRMPDVTPFSSRVAAGGASAAIWERVGACVGRFHAAGFYHADLSTHNLQIDSADNISLLDWDRGRQLKPGSWCKRNLDRLHRSCVKISRDGQTQFSAADWQALIRGYESAGPCKA